MGRFDEAIVQYNKALAIQPNFVNSHFGIAAALAYQGKTSDAQAELQKITEKARSDGERRTALFGQMVVAVDSGKLDQALAEVEKQYALGQKNNDVPAMAGDLQLKGNILLEMGRQTMPKGIRSGFEGDVRSNLSQEVKDNAARVYRYNLARVAVAKKDLAAAKTEAETFRKGCGSCKECKPAQAGSRTRRQNCVGGEELRCGNSRADAGEPTKSRRALPAGPGLSGQGRHCEGKREFYESREVQFTAAVELRIRSQ